MSLLRLIARLDIKGPSVVKGIQFEGLRVVGKPEELALRYSQDADELLYIDTVATLYGRPQVHGLLERTTEKVFIPITVGGGVRSLQDVKGLLRAGADKVAINTAAVANPDLLNDVANACGSQALVLSVEAKQTAKGWEVYTENGRERTGKDVVAWIAEGVKRGAGEVLLTSIDRDGTRKGFDTALIRAVGELPVPLTVSGGMGNAEHAKSALEAGADALAFATVLHYGRMDIAEIRNSLGVRHERRTRTLAANDRGSPRLEDHP